MRGEAGADNSFSRLFPTFTRISLKRNSLGGGSQPRLSDSSPSVQPKRQGRSAQAYSPCFVPTTLAAISRSDGCGSHSHRLCG